MCTQDWFSIPLSTVVGNACHDYTKNKVRGWGIWLQGQKCWFQSSRLPTNRVSCWNISLNIQEVSDIFILPFSRDLSVVSGGWNCSRLLYAQQPMGKKDSTCASQGFNPVHPLAPALWQVQIPDRAGMAVLSVTDIWTTVLCFQGVVLCSCQIVLKRIFLNIFLKWLNSPNMLLCWLRKEVWVFLQRVYSVCLALWCPPGHGQIWVAPGQGC